MQHGRLVSWPNVEVLLQTLMNLGAVAMAVERLLLSVLLLAAIACSSFGVTGFQSDELPEDAEEWGLVGESAPIVKPKINIVEKVEPEYTEYGEKIVRPSAATAGTKKITFPLEHSLGDGKFEQIGTFSALLRTTALGHQEIKKLRLERNKLSKVQKRQFEELVRNDGFYTIRLPADLIKPRHKFVLASVKGRCLTAAKLKERFDFFLDRGNLIGVSYSAVGACSYPRPLVLPEDWTFASDPLIFHKGSEQAPRLVPMFQESATQRPGEKVTEEEGTKEKTFWQKYWMYIVPFGLIVVNALSQLANLPEEPTAGQTGPAITGTQRTGGSGGGRARR